MYRHALAPAGESSSLLIEDVTATAGGIAGFSDHERILVGRDDERGLTAIIAIHDTTLGPALGGTRIWMHNSFDEAMGDALRLSRAMTLKAVVAGLALGGGKAVIRADPRRDKTPQLLDAYAEMLACVQREYITAEDVGMSLADADHLRTQTPNVAGTSAGGSGNPSPFTALGVLLGIQAALRFRTGSQELEGRHVAIQGLGAVGMNLAAGLHEAGARLTVADVDATRAREAAARFGATPVTVDEILSVEADVFAPCALGNILTPAAVGRLGAGIVAGAANNPLARAEVADRLADEGILYAPDFVINAGGLINVAAELEPGGYDPGRVRQRIGMIPATLARIFEEAGRSGRSTESVATSLALQRIGAAR